MGHNRRFVQFSHPGREHEPDPGGVKGWNTYASPHARKFMEFRGKWIEEDGSARSGDLRAWGEWEAESELVCQFSQPSQSSLYPRYLWRPYYIPKGNYEWLHNTDPFIFGERFLYSNCKQRKVSGLAHLGRGSVIAFGSGRKIAGERKWMLDTVLVVADSLTYRAPEARQVLADPVPEAFLTVTGGPIGDNEAASFRLYMGAAPDDPVEGMFSFFPAMPAYGDVGFPRPLINLPGEYFNPRSWQAPKGLRVCLQSLELVLNLMNEPQIVPQRPDGRTVGDPRPPTPTSQARRPAPYSGPAGGSERHPVFASERMSLADGPARSASLADPVQILPQLDHGWNVGTSQ